MCRVSAAFDYLSGRMSVRGPVHLVLHRSKELQGKVRAGIVVDARRVDIEDLAPENLFGRPDVADSGEQFVKVVEAVNLFEAIVIQCKALDDVFPETFSGPTAELGTPVGSNSVTYGNNDI